MPRILILSENPQHWDAILPVLPWLDDAGAQVRLPRGAGQPLQGLLRDAARTLGFEDPRLKRAHAGWGSRFDLALGTVDDLPLLRAREEPFLALARLPIPVSVVSEPVPPPIRPLVEEARGTSIAELLQSTTPSHREFASRIDGLPFICTGCPELDLEDEEAAPMGRIVILHSGDLIDEETLGDESRKRHVRVLERLLTPLLGLGRPIELRAALTPGPEQDEASMREALRYLAHRHKLDIDAVTVHSTSGWNQLSSARAVLALSYADALRALGAGTARVWYLPFVRAELPDAEATPVEGMTISSWARFARWVEDRGWEKPSDDARNIARITSEASDGRSAGRIAQMIMSVAEWDWGVLEES